MIGWQLALALLIAGAVVAFMMGRGAIAQRYQPLATFVLALIAISAVVSLNEYWRQQREEDERRLAVVGALREIRGDLNDYRRMLATTIPEVEGAIRVDRTAFTPARRSLPDEIFHRLHQRPEVLKRLSAVGYEQIANLLARMNRTQRGLDGADDATWVRQVALLERDVELLDKILSWEGIYQQDVLTLDQLTRFIPRLDPPPASSD